MPIFDGKTYDPALDGSRLTTLLERVWAFMSDGKWRSLAEISKATGGTEASVNARLRDFRKPRNGGYEVEHLRVSTSGLWLYRIPQGQVATPYNPDEHPPEENETEDKTEVESEGPSKAELNLALAELRTLLELPGVIAARNASGSKFSDTFVKVFRGLAERAKP